VEVWLNGRGWVRVDPTAAVAPDRVERSIDNQQQTLDGEIVFKADDDGVLGKTLRQFQLTWDSVNNSLNQWVLNYDQAQQSKFLRGLGLGIDSWKSTLVALMIGMGTLMGILTVSAMLKRHRPGDPLRGAWQRFYRKLAKLGINPAPEEGPRDLCHRIVEKKPELASQVKEICGLYIGLRYGRRTDTAGLGELKRRIRAFRAM
jgi:hypothetical protein